MWNNILFVLVILAAFACVLYASDRMILYIIIGAVFLAVVIAVAQAYFQVI